MTLGYILSFAAAALSLLACWFYRYQRKRYVFLALALAVTVCFFVFAVGDARQIQEKAAIQQQTQESAGGYQVTLTEYRQTVIDQELAIMAQYKWNDATADLLDETNLRAAGGIFRNVRLSELYEQATILAQDSDAYQKMLKMPCAGRTEGYHLSGFCLRAAVCDAPEVAALFLPKDGSCTLLAIDCAWDAEQTQTAFIVLFPVTVENSERLTPHEGGSFGCSATYVGTLPRDGEAVPVFMHN